MVWILRRPRLDGVSSKLVNVSTKRSSLVIVVGSVDNDDDDVGILRLEGVVNSFCTVGLSLRLDKVGL